MAAVEPLCTLIGIDQSKLSKEESYILEAELITQIYEELKILFKEKHKNYFRLLKFNLNKERAMLEDNFVPLILKDILATEEYTLNGIAQYIGMHEDVVNEVLIGRNVSPSITLFRKIIELHRSVRKDFYQTIIKKITLTYLMH